MGGVPDRYVLSQPDCRPIKSPIRAEGEGILLSEVRAINSLAERSEGYYMPCKREGRKREIPL